MPKGVEHPKTAPHHGGDSRVIHSLMPKGVEHTDKPEPIELDPGDSFVDAERR